MHERPSIKVIRFTGKRLANGASPIMLRLIYRREVRKWGLGYDATAEQWDPAGECFRRTVKEHASRNAVLTRVKADASGIVDAMIIAGETFSMDRFAERYRSDRDREDLLAFIQTIVEELEGVERVGNADSYRSLAGVVRRCTGGKPITFASITPTWLQTFERSMRDHGANDGGIAAQMRAMRAVVNRAIRDGFLRIDQYPFQTSKVNGYNMAALKSSRKSRALTDAEMERLKAYQFGTIPEVDESARYFLISYYARGMNLTDMAEMPPDTLENGVISYQRQKTIRKRTVTVINIPIRGPLAELLEPFRGNKPYLLPIYGDLHRTKRQKMDRLNKVRGQVNDGLKVWAEACGVKADLTMYYARHTYATKLVNEGVGLRKLQELMDHSSYGVTERYVASLMRTGEEPTDELL